MKITQGIVFGLMVLAQFAVPVSMILSKEAVLQNGTEYRFRCGPVDPYDFLRGRYVALSFPDMRIADWRGERFEPGSRAYVTFEPDPEGFARILAVSSRRPEGRDYLVVQAWAGSYENAPLQLTLPFDKFFMNERDAPAAEAAYRAEQRTETGVHAVVRIQDGDGVIEDLFIGDIPIKKYLEQQAASLEDTTLVP